LVVAVRLFVYLGRIFSSRHFVSCLHSVVYQSLNGRRVN